MVLGLAAVLGACGNSAPRAGAGSGGASQTGGQLGSVSGRIVGEVLVGIIDSDPESFRSVDPEWEPTLPGRAAGSFGLADILVPAR